MSKFLLVSRFYYAKLSDDNKRLYRTIYDSWAQGESSVSFTSPGEGFNGHDGISLHDIVLYIIADNPHLFHLETSHVNYKRNGHTVTIFLENIYSRTEYNSIYEKLMARVQGIMANSEMRGTNDQRIRFLHDYLANNIVYHKSTSDRRSQREVHTIVGALLNGACVCDGYSRALRLLCDLAQISCIVTEGYAHEDAEGGGPSQDDSSNARHAWNIVKFNGQTYHIDVTWDSGKDPISHFYFLRDDNFFKHSHSWDTALYPTCTFTYPRNEPLITTQRELNDFLVRTAAFSPNCSIIHLGGSMINEENFESAISKAASHMRLTRLRSPRYRYVFRGKEHAAEIFLG